MRKTLTLLAFTSMVLMGGKPSGPTLDITSCTYVNGVCDDSAIFQIEATGLSPKKVYIIEGTKDGGAVTYQLIDMIPDDQGNLSWTSHSIGEPGTWTFTISPVNHNFVPQKKELATTVVEFGPHN